MLKNVRVLGKEGSSSEDSIKPWCESGNLSQYHLWPHSCPSLRYKAGPTAAHRQKCSNQPSRIAIFQSEGSTTAWTQSVNPGAQFAVVHVFEAMLNLPCGCSSSLQGLLGQILAPSRCQIQFLSRWFCVDRQCCLWLLTAWSQPHATSQKESYSNRK